MSLRMPPRPHHVLCFTSADRLAALRVAGSPAPRADLASAPLTSTAAHAAAGLPGSTAHPAPQLLLSPPRLVPAAALSGPPAAFQAAADGAGAGADEVAAVPAVAVTRGDGRAGQPRWRQQPQAELASRLHELPQASLPLLAAAAEAAAEIERQEERLAAATAACVAGPPPPSVLQPQRPSPLLPVLQQPLLSPRQARRVLALQPASLP
jgi:hypothetical protein